MMVANNYNLFQSSWPNADKPQPDGRNQKDNLQLIEEPSGLGFISWVFLSVGKSLCFFCKDLTCNGLRQISDRLKSEALRAAQSHQ
jgi:hypothetical protein